MKSCLQDCIVEEVRFALGKDTISSVVCESFVECNLPVQGRFLNNPYDCSRRCAGLDS